MKRKRKRTGRQGETERVRVEGGIERRRGEEGGRRDTRERGAEMGRGCRLYEF